MHKHASDLAARLCETCRKAQAQKRPLWIARRTEDAAKVSSNARAAVSVSGGTRF